MAAFVTNVVVCKHTVLISNGANLKASINRDMVCMDLTVLFI